MRFTRWLLFGLLLISASVCLRLAVWQLSRLRQRREFNSRVVAARLRPALTIQQAAAAPPESLAERRIRVVGEFDFARSLALRGSQRDGLLGIEIVTPLRVPGDSARVLVDRGWAPAPDGVGEDPASFVEPPGARVEGLISLLGQSPDSGGPSRPAPGAAERTTYRNLNARGMAGRLPYPVRSFYVRQLPDAAAPGRDGLPRRWGAPPPDEGPHLSYALQWSLFAACCLVGAGFVALRPLRTSSPPRP